MIKWGNYRIQKIPDVKPIFPGEIVMCIMEWCETSTLFQLRKACIDFRKYVQVEFVKRIFKSLNNTTFDRRLIGSSEGRLLIELYYIIALSRKPFSINIVNIPSTSCNVTGEFRIIKNPNQYINRYAVIVYKNMDLETIERVLFKSNINGSVVRIWKYWTNHYTYNKIRETAQAKHDMVIYSVGY